MSRHVPAEDLLVLARQCKLNEQEERRFELAVQSSRELECLYEAGVRFDDEAGLLSGDDARLNRLVERTLASIEQSQAPNASSAARTGTSRRTYTVLVARYFAASLAIGLLLCVTLASAWEYLEKRAAQSAPQARQAREASVLAEHQPKLLPKAALNVASAAPPLAQTSVSEVNRSKPPPVARPRKLAPDEQQSAQELFALASGARQKGDLEAAISLYERLEREYPSSVEADDAQVLCGDLLLSQGSPRAALRQFQAYSKGALSLEAAWGRAQALRKLHSPDEQATLLEVIRDYPGSPYAEAAEKRLRDLSR